MWGRAARKHRVAVIFVEVEGKDSHLLSVYNFCFCLPRPRAIEEYLSKSAGLFCFRLFLFYEFVLKQLFRGTGT